jgi:transposase
MLIPNDIKLFLYNEPTDMRKSINTLMVLVSDTLQMNPASGHLFLFRNRRGDKLKALYYEPNSFTLWYRRLEQGRFIFPKTKTGSLEMSAEHFHWLLASDKYTHLTGREGKTYDHFY